MLFRSRVYLRVGVVTREDLHAAGDSFSDPLQGDVDSVQIFPSDYTDAQVNATRWCGVRFPMLTLRFFSSSQIGLLYQLASVASPFRSYSFSSAVGLRLQNGAQWLAGAPPHFGVVDFDGSAAYIDLGQLTLGGGSFSAAAWVKYRTFRTWSRVFDLGNGAASNNVLLANQGTTNTLAFHVYNYANNRESTEAIEHGIDCGLITQKWRRWCPISGTRACGCMWLRCSMPAANPVLSTRMVCFAVLFAAALNLVRAPTGQPQTLQTGYSIKGYAPNNLPRSQSFVARSNWPADSYFDGQIDQLVLYEAALSATDAALLYNSAGSSSHLRSARFAD